MDFGLGLILSFTDNATAGINNAVNSLARLTETANGAMSSMNQMASLSALSVISNQLGSSFTSAGGKILGVFSNLLGHVQKTGSDFENFRITLTAVYGDAERAEQAIGKLLDFSIKSPFEVEGVKNMLILLQSQGIDAFSDMQGAITKTHQETLSWIADLMAFKPEEPAMRWKRALTNYIGSGQGLMLRNILDMGSIEQILGHAISSTVEGRMNDIMEIVENKNLTGLAEKLSLSWTGVASNIADAWTKLYKSIADNKVFENLKFSFMSLSGAILSMSNEDLESFGKTMADGLNLIIKPITMVTDKVNDLLHSLVDLSKTNPGLIKLSMVFAAISGVVLVSIGVFLKATSALSGLSLMYLAFGNQFNSLGALFKAGSMKILGALLPLTLAIGVLYMVWKNDLGGIATTVDTFTKNISRSFSVANKAVSGGLVGMYSVLRNLNIKENFFDGLTLAIMRLIVLGKALFEGWNDYELSTDTFMKMQALGIKPLVESIFDLKYRFDNFVLGFKEGFGSVLKSVKDFFKGLASNVEGTVFEDALDSITLFFQKLSDNDPSAWKDLGNTLGIVAGKALILFSAFKVLDWITGKVLKVIGIFTTLLGLVGKVGVVFIKLGGLILKPFSNITGVFNIIGSGVTTVIKAFKDLFTVIRGGSVAPTKLGSVFIKVFDTLKTTILGIIGKIGVSGLAAIGVVIASVFTFIVTQKDKFFGMLGDFWEHLMTNFDGVKERFTMVVDTVTTLISPAVELVKGAIDNLKGAFSSLGQSKTVSTIISAVVRVLSFLGEIIVGVVLPNLKMLVSFVSGALKAAFDVLGGLIAGVVTAVSGLFAGLVNVISGIINIVTGILDTIGGLIKGIFTGDFSMFFEGLKSIGTGILQVAGGIVEAIAGVLVGAVEILGGIIAGVFDLGVDVVKGIIEGITSTVSNVVTAITDLGKSIINAFKNFFGIHSPSTVFAGFGKNLIEGLLQGIQSLWNSVTTFFSSSLEGIKSTFTSAWNSVKTTVSQVMTTIKTTITNVWSNIKTSVHSFMVGIVQEIIHKFHEAKTFVTNLASEALNWGSDIVGNIAQGIKNTVGKVTDAVTGVADKIRSFLHFSVPDEGPLTDMPQWMPDMMNQLAAGIQANRKVISAAVSQLSYIIHDMMGSMMTKLATMLSVGLNTFMSGLREFMSFLTNMWRSITSTIANFVSGVKSFVPKVFDAMRKLQTIFTSVVKTVTTTWTSLRDNILSVLEKVKTSVSTIWTAMKNNIFATLEKVRNVVSTAWAAMRNNVFSVLEKVRTSVSTTFNAIYSALRNGMESAKTLVSSTFKFVRSIVLNGITALKNLVFSTFKAVSSTVQGYMATVKTNISTAWSSIHNTVSTVLSGIKSTVTSLLGAVKSTVSTIFKSIRSTASTILGTLSSEMSTKWNQMANVINTKVGVIKRVILSGFAEARNFVKNLSGESATWGADIVTNIAKGIFNSLSTVTRAVKSVAKEIRSYLHFSVPDVGPLTDFNSWMPDMMNQLAEGVTKNSTVVTAAFNAVANVMTTETKRMMESVTNTFKTGWETVSLEIPTYWRNIESTVTTSADNVKAAFKKSWSELSTIAATEWNDVADTVSQSLSVIAEKSKNVFSSLPGNSSTYMTAIASAVRTSWNSALSSTTDTLNAVTSKVNTFASKVKSKVTNLMGSTKTVINTSLGNIESSFDTAGNSIQSSVTNTFNGMNATINSAMATAKNTISTALSDMQNQFANTVFKFNRNIAMPHFNMDGKFNAETGQVPTLDVSWYKTGGVFDEPTLVGVGEAGREAVVPLESNTEWIKELAYQIGGYLPNEEYWPTPVSTITNTSGSSYYGDTNSYMTNTTGGNTDSHNIEDSHDVTFEAGSITVQVMNASEEEAERFATLIMQKVKRKQELEDMLHYKRR